MTAIRGSRFYRGTRWVLRQLGFAYFRLSVTGLDQLPPTGPAILAGNHPNVLDGILLLIVSPRPVRFLVAEELYFHRYLHGFFTAFGCIPVYRTKAENGDALRAAVDALERGEVIGIFPEGTTADLGRMRLMKRGVGLLALRTGCPIVPFGIAGSDEAYPVGRRVPRPIAISLALAPAIAFPKVTMDPIPVDCLQRTLDDTRWEIIRAMRWADRQQTDEPPWWELKRLRVAASALIVWPLAGFLHATANPSLDPIER